MISRISNWTTCFCLFCCFFKPQSISSILL